MKRITFEKSDCKQETTSSWLIALIEFGKKIDFFEPLKNFWLKLKGVDYSVFQKLITLMLSIAIGCEYMKDINEKLAPEVLAANSFGMNRFPDQSQINALLTRMDEDSIKQLQDIHHELFMKNSNSIHTDDDIIIDLDQSGLIANGKSYELAEKGYFAKKKNQRGYQLSAAFASKFKETVALFLDPGNIHCSYRFADLMSAIVFKFKEHIRNGNVILRADSGYGSAENIEKLCSIKGLKFVVKCFSIKTAAKLAKNIPYSDYTQINNTEWVYELPEENGLRHIIVQILTRSGELKYTMLITNISRDKMDAIAIFNFYNGRQTIEAFFKTCKNVYSMKNLRTTRFYGIYGFLWLVFITHNLITLFKTSMLAGTELEGAGVKVLVKKFGNVRGIVERNSEGIRVIIPALTKLSEFLAEILSESRHHQLSFLT